MKKIFVIMGKSATGKDHIYRRLLDDGTLDIRPLVSYTTRPMRLGEQNGREYFFTDEEHLNELRESGRIIEERIYPTVHGDWHYFMADEGQFDSPDKAYVIIGTLESYNAMRRYFGDERMAPVYIETDDGIRLTRAVKREKKQEHPAFAEVCRRFLADAEDFSEDKLAEAGITRRFRNNDEIVECTEKIKDFIRRNGEG